MLTNQMTPQNLNRINNLKALSWACRRGMLELDMILGAFLTEKYLTLTDAHKILFVDLLALPDPLLYEWLLGVQVEVHDEFLPLVELIRCHARSPI
ncbi:MAG: succinate dehydrogenase assembly factor 2 [Gammaproteobacteria bacterium]|nr:succinate dehydrogenase assembly factor 2 [Gammaproteobacteria bacterium]